MSYYFRLGLPGHIRSIIGDAHISPLQQAGPRRMLLLSPRLDASSRRRKRIVPLMGQASSRRA